MKLLLLASLLLIAAATAAMPPLRGLPRRGPAAPLRPAGATPGTGNCSVHFYSQPLDHFGFRTNATFPQRYYVCLPENWRGPNSTVFFYTGNEANVDLFVNATGLMWENAAAFSAVLVFAEHRYFGESLPFPGQKMPPAPQLQYLSVDQALADYAKLIQFLRLSPQSPVGAGTGRGSTFITFGGSYGGMLSSWLRIKYPWAVQGAIAGSAPIVNFEGMDPAYNPNAFQDVVTFDATAAGGAASDCADNIRSAFQRIFALMNSGDFATLSAELGTCKPIASVDDAWGYVNDIANAFGMMAMSSYPFPSNYLLLGGKGILPAYPMRVGCAKIAGAATPSAQVRGLVQVVNVYFNATGAETCLNDQTTVNEATEIVNYLWGYLACTTMFMPFGTNGVTDMFWNAPWNATASLAACQQQFPGVVTRPDWVAVEYGGWWVARGGSNIVFSNGQLDPWRPGGITHATAPSVATVIVADAGHHMDLMFSNPADMPSVRAARAVEVEHMHRWVREHTQRGK